MDKEFYIVLPSNVQSEEFLNNSTSQYSTALPSHLQLGKDKWEVALVSITYPHTWYNVEPGDAYIEIFRNGVKNRLRFPQGYYSGGNELVLKLNEILTNNGVNGYFTYDSQSNKVTISLSEGEHIKLSKDFSALLGFSFREFNYPALGDATMEDTPNLGLVFESLPKLFNAINCVDLNIKTHNMFVYTNIIKEILVGNNYMPLLRTVATHEKNRGTYISENYIVPYYLPLSSNYIKQITIDLRDDQGENIKFRGGKVTVMLHFRMVKNTN